MFLLHLACSCVVLLIILGLFYCGWYRWPGWHLVGAGKVVGMLAVVDLAVGPLATFVVCNPSKRLGELRRDIALVAVLQLGALAYGGYSLWLGRPLFYAFSGDRIEVVTANALDERDISLARSTHSPIIPEWHSLPRWVWAPLPDDPSERDSIVRSAVFEGRDVTAMPRFFRPFADGLRELRARFLPVDSLIGRDGLSAIELDRRVASLDRSREGLAAVPVQGRARNGVMVFDRASGVFLTFWPVDPWLEKAAN